MLYFIDEGIEMITTIIRLSQQYTNPNYYLQIWTIATLKLSLSVIPYYKEAKVQSLD